MTSVPRRTVAQGLAWSVPAVAAVTAAPFSAASPKINVPTTNSCSDKGCVDPWWPTDGSMTYSLSGGGASDVSVAVHWGATGPSTVKGSISWLWNDGIGQNDAVVPPTWVKLNDGTLRRGTATLGGTASYVAESGVNSSTTFQFNDSFQTSLFEGATIYAPYKFVWTPQGGGKTLNCFGLAVFALGTSAPGVHQLANEPRYDGGLGCAPECPTKLTSVVSESKSGINQFVGSILTVNGSGMSGVISATYDGVPVTDLVVVSDSQITFRIPQTSSIEAASVWVETVTATGCKAHISATKTNQCVLDVTNVINANYATPGTTVTIRGTRFTGATGATYNGVPVTNFKVVNDTTITYTVPTAPGIWGSLYPLVVSGPYCSDTAQVYHS